jgi:phosphopantetheinyl transferase
MMNAQHNNNAAVYGVNINSIVSDTPVFERQIDLFPPGRARKIRSYRFNDDRKRSFAAGLLLQTVLGREAAFRVREDARGKPFIDGGPHFSVSHSGDWAVIAVCGAPVGFDIEEVKTPRDTAGIAGRAFHPLELADAACGVDMFYRIWAAKESYIKMLGHGLAGMAGFRVSFAGLAGSVEGRPDAAIKIFDNIPGYAAAVCSSAGIAWSQEITAISPCFN